VSDITVRTVDSNDDALLQLLRDLALRSKASWGYDDEFMRGFAEVSLPTRLHDDGRSCLVAEEGQIVVGFAILDAMSDHLWLEDMWVDPGRMGRGVGRALWLSALARLNESPFPEIRFEADPNAVGFYERMGACVTDERASTVIPGRMLPLMTYLER
jgi:ribosomal protein S18 acetylase RimI-like enzyme